MGLLSGLISTATNAVGANENAQAQAAKSNMAAALQRAQLERQDQQDQIAQAVQSREAQSQALKDQLTGAQIKDTNAQLDQRAYANAHPKAEAPTPGTPEWRRMKIDEARIGAQYGYHPDSFTPTVITDPNTHEQHIGSFNTHTGVPKDTGILGKQPTGAAGGGASGAQVPVADMEARYAEIAKSAGDLAAGKIKITPGMQTREGLNYANDLSTAGGHPSAGNILAAGAFNTLGIGGKGYQDYEQLMTSTRALGDDVAKVFKGRQNEQSVLREIALSRITPQDAENPQNVQRKLNRLQHVIALAKLNNPGQEGLEGPQTAMPGSASPSAQIGGGFDDLPNAR